MLGHLTLVPVKALAPEVEYNCGESCQRCDVGKSGSASLTDLERTPSEYASELE